MKNTIKVFVLVALTLAAMSVSAQVKLGHIETQKLIQAMPEWTAAQKTFEEEQKKVNTELNSLREQFQTKLAEYSEKMKTYSELCGLQQKKNCKDCSKESNVFRKRLWLNWKKHKMI